VIVLDSYAVIAALRGEPAAAEVTELLRGEEDSTLTPLGVAEVVDRLVRGAGAHPDEVALDLAELGLAEPDPLEAGVALRAGMVRARHYHRIRCAVSLADCVAVEVARHFDGAVATSDAHLLDVCAAEGVRVMPLPDSSGGRWSAPDGNETVS
jgi:predicted nucleic acid-binding protein